MELINKIKQGYERWVTLTPNNLLYDRTLVWLFVILLCIGFIMVTSASIPIGTRLFDDPFHFSKRDAVYVFLAVVTCYAFLKVPMAKWEKWHVRLFFIALALLVLVAIPGIGREVNGARRWIPLAFFNFQPAEFAKLALICFLASYFTRRYDELQDMGADNK